MNKMLVNTLLSHEAILELLYPAFAPLDRGGPTLVKLRLLPHMHTFSIHQEHHCGRGFSPLEASKSLHGQKTADELGRSYMCLAKCQPSLSHHLYSL